MMLAVLALLACWGGSDSGGDKGTVDAETPEPTRRGKKSARGDRPSGERFEAVFGSNPCGAPLLPGKGSIAVTFGGKSYDVVSSVPTSAGQRDLVILLHGGRGKPSTILKQTDFAERADEINALVLAPQAEVTDESPTPKWNNGKYLPSDGIKWPRDDVAFLEALVAEAKAKACIDNVLVVGFSGGAVMANRWLCEGKTPPDAILTAAGSLTQDGRRCDPQIRAVRAYVGTADERYTDPVVEGRGMNAVATAEFWARHNKCRGVQEDKKGDTTCRTWKGCEAPVSLCIVEGFPHEFPRGPHGSPRTSEDAAEVGWKWFEDVKRRR